MKIPEKAKSVFKGVIFEVYQWDQEMFDGSMATYEAIKRADTVQVIATQGDRVLISSEEQPGKERFLTLLGGRVEEGEEPLAAIKRELREESGLESSDWEVFNVYSAPGKIEWNVHIFIARHCKQAGEKHLDAGERIEVQSLSFEEFLAAIESPDFRGREILFDLLRMKLEPKKLEEFGKKLFRK